MDLFNDIERKEEKVEIAKVNSDVSKLKEFAEVNDSLGVSNGNSIKSNIQLDFNIDDATLDKINSTPMESIQRENSVHVKEQEVIKPAPFLEEENKDDSVNNGNVDESDINKNNDNTKNPVDKMDYVLDTIDDYGNKIADSAVNAGKKAIYKLRERFPIWMSIVRDRHIRSKFEHGDLIVTDEFKFFRLNNELMVYKYTGTSQHIVIPDKVGNLPVKYVYGGFINNNIFDNFSLRAHMNPECDSDIKSIQFSRYLEYLPMNLFVGCKQLKVVVIPESVRVMATNVFSTSNLDKVYLNCPVPNNFGLVELPDSLSIYCRKEYSEDYRNMIGGVV